MVTEVMDAVQVLLLWNWVVPAPESRDTVVSEENGDALSSASRTWIPVTREQTPTTSVWGEEVKAILAGRPGVTVTPWVWGEPRPRFDAVTVGIPVRLSRW